MPRKREPDRWPWPKESQIDRARRVAASYRHALQVTAPDVCEHLDTAMRDFGQGWIAPGPQPYDDNDLLTAELAADFLYVKTRTIDAYQRRGLRVTDTVDGPRYRVADLREFSRGRNRCVPPS